jgi:hypothetical protein
VLLLLLPHLLEALHTNFHPALQRACAGPIPALQDMFKDLDAPADYIDCLVVYQSKLCQLRVWQLPGWQVTPVKGIPQNDAIGTLRPLW